jgi:hypothetical protein
VLLISVFNTRTLRRCAGVLMLLRLWRRRWQRGRSRQRRQEPDILGIVEEQPEHDAPPLARFSGVGRGTNV